MLRLSLLVFALSYTLFAQPKTIVFSRLGASQIGLFVSNADGTDEHPLLKSDSLDYNPVWSPDGKWIVFTSERNGSADLFRVRPDGIGLERLTDNPAYDDQADFSPDGRRIVFVSTRADGTADLWIMDLSTRKVRPLTSGPAGDFRPAWSPDGKWIAFSSDRGYAVTRDGGGKWWVHLQRADIYIIRPDGTGLKRLTNDGNFCGGPRWSRDSRSLIGYCMSAEETFAFRPSPSISDNANAQVGRALLRGDTHLVSIDVTTLKKAEIPSAPGIKIFPSILRDGEIAYVRKDADGPGPGIYYVTGKKGPHGWVRSPSWSPDGTRLVYHRLISMQTPGWQKIWSRNPEYELVITRALPAFNPDGKYLVATQHDPSIMVITSTGQGETRTLFQQEGKLAEGPQWSPKGDYILFGIGQYYRNRAQGAQVASIKTDGSDLRELTSGANNNGFPSFSPDGTRFVYRTFGPEGQGLRIMNLDSKQVTILTEEYDNFPKWSPRGDLIAFVRRYQDSFVIFTIAPDGTNLKRLTDPGGDDAHLDWSPDGEWIAFSSARMGFKDEALNTDSPQPYGEIFVMRYDGTQVQQLTDNQWEDGGPAWLPSSRAAKSERGR